MHPWKASIWTRFSRSFFMLSLVSIFFLLLPVCAFARDGEIIINGKKVDTLYRFKKGVKYLPAKQVCESVGLDFKRDGKSLLISGSYKGDQKITERSNRLLKRDGAEFLSVDFWKKDIGLDVLEKGETLYVVNRIVKVEKRSDGILIVTAVKAPDMKTFEIDNPSRTVCDIPNLSIGDNFPETKFDFTDLPFNSIRIGQVESYPHKGRIVIDHGTSPSFKPVANVINSGALWIGKTAYKNDVKKPDTPESDLLKSDIIMIDEEGTIRFRGVKFDKVEVSHLWDKFPYRAVFDLHECTLPFKDEKVYEGYGTVGKIRIAQNKEKIARIVVEFTGTNPLGYKVISENDLQIFIPTMQMKKGFKVLIDPGHGGYDCGALVTSKEMGGLSAIEKDINLKLAKELGTLLQQRGIQVYFTRSNDSFLSLEQRRDMANQLGVDLMISVHTNATPQRPQSFVSGPEVYYHYARDEKLAREIWNNMSWRTGVRGRGAFFCRFLVTMNPNVPSILVETAYINNPVDLAALTNGSFEYGRQAMMGVADGVAKHFGLSTVPVVQTEVKTSEKKVEDPKVDVFRPRIPIGNKLKKITLIDPDDTETPILRKKTTFDPPDNKKKLMDLGEGDETPILVPPDEVKDKEQVILGGGEKEKEKKKENVKEKEKKKKSEADKKKKEKIKKEELKKRKKNIFKLY